MPLCFLGQDEPDQLGPARRTFDGVTRSISFFFARIRPGTDGYRGRLIPSRTATTAGTGTSNISQPPGASRRAVTVPEPISSPFAPVTIGRSRAVATRIPTWNPPESPICSRTG